MIRRILVVLATAPILAVFPTASAFASSNSNTLNLPDGLGSLTSDSWRGDGTNTGSGRHWEYQVSATYQGANSVERIRTTWWGKATLRNSARLDLGLADSGVTADPGSGWGRVETPKKYWENGDGATSSSWRTSMYVDPEQDYLGESVETLNLAMVKLAGDDRTFEVEVSS